MTAVSKAQADAVPVDYLEQHLIGPSADMVELRELVRRAAQLDTPVLVEGETGTGKEIVAQALHHLGRRRGRLVALNVAELRHELAEAELFGVVRGAFTGATDRIGRIEQADGGTLFLDEAADLPLPLQARLLRVLETGRFSRVGEARERVARFRLVVTIQQSSATLLAEKRWRSDLFYRLARLHLRLPPLALREADIMTLVNHFLVRHGVAPLPAEGHRELLAYGWPGNVRELSNAVERAVFLAGGTTVEVGNIVAAARQPVAARATEVVREPPSVTRLRPTGGRFSDVIRVAERAHIEEILRMHGHRVRDTAAALGISRAHLYRRIRELSIELSEVSTRD